MNESAKVCDPEQVSNNYMAKKRRQHRLQLTPPMSYWNRYEADKLAEEEAELKLVEEVMDAFGIFLSIIVITLFIALLSFHARIFWLPPLICVGTVIWWAGWGRYKYE